MNLVTTLDLWAVTAGGPGSGCVGETCGRPKGRKGGGKSQIKKTLAKWESLGYTVVDLAKENKPAKDGFISPDGKYGISTGKGGIGVHDAMAQDVGKTTNKMRREGWIRKTGKAGWEIQTSKQLKQVQQDLERTRVTGWDTIDVDIMGEGVTLRGDKDSYAAGGFTFRSFTKEHFKVRKADQ